ncbi:MAG: S41 family peptidase [Oscillospiraceae bacterium]
MENHRGVTKIVIGCLLSALVGAGLVFFAFYSYFGGSQGFAFVKKLNAVRLVIEERYVGETDFEELTDAAASAMVAATGDRWSYYMDSDSFAAYRDQTNNSTTGIGVTVSQNTEGTGFPILSVTEDSPAGRAGILPGHTIVGLAGQNVRSLDTVGLRALIKAQTGEYAVTLLDENGGEYTVTLKNEVIFNDPVSYELLADGVGYIRIANFQSGAAEGAIAAIETLAGEGMTAIVFDVRHDPGGQLSELTALLDYILPEGEIFVSVDKDGNEDVTRSDAACIDYPMAVLIDADTYSAAEFFAAVLREYGYASVLGEASTGKARSQQTFELFDGSAVHISTRSYLTPARVNLAEEGGLVPDLAVSLGEEGDAQLDAAVKYLLDRD